MLYRLLFTSFFCCIGCCQIVAQNNSFGEKVVFPSPQAAQFSKFGDSKINHSSGLPIVNIPLYTAREGALNVPITLSYNYPGFRPADQAGWCGLGWSLLAGGSITRTMRGTADEIVPGQMSKIQTFVDGIIPDLTAYETLNFQGLGNDYQETAPDVFSFQFDGYSGKFVLDTTGSPHIISDQRLVFTFEKSAYGPENKQVITKWTVKGDNGNMYEFNAFEVSYQNANAIYLFPSAWYLTQIINPKGDKVTFEYSAKNSLESGKARVQSRISDQSSSNNGYISSVSLDYSLEIYLQKIKGSLWEVNFNSSEYWSFVESATSFARKLDNIQVLDNQSNLIKRFNFVYKDVSSYKLTLENVGEEGAPPHIFEYNSSIGRDVHGVGRQVDYWGYYNGETNPILIPGEPGVDLEPRLAQTKIGSLEKITYPTGGNTTFEYELNEYSYIQTFLTNKTKFLIDNFDFFWLQDTSNPRNNPDPSITITEPTRVDIRLRPGLNPTSNCTAFQNSNFITVQLDPGTYSGDDLLRLPQFAPCNQVFGNCDPEIMNPCPFIPPLGYEAHMSVKVFRKYSTSKPYFGGIRIAKITDTPVSPGTTPVISTYSYSDRNNIDLSSGIILDEPVFDFTVTTAVVGLPPIRLRRSSPYNPLAMNAVYYKDVKESNSEFETQYTFTSHFDKADTKGKWAMHMDKEISGPGFFSQVGYMNLGDLQTYDLFRGMPRIVEVKDLNGNLKQKKETIYSSFDSETFSIGSLYHELLTTYEFWGVDLGGATSKHFRNIYYGKAYYIVGGWPRKISETTTTYGSNNTDPVSTTVTYEYANTDHLQMTKQRTTQSDGTVLENAFKYPLDYKNVSGKAAFIQPMIDANMITYPIEQATVLEKSPSDRKHIDATVTTYKSFTGNSNLTSLILPYKEFRFNGMDNSIGSFVPYAGTTDETASASYREILKFTNYDNRGNPISLLTNNSKKTSYLWAYKGQYPVAKIENADYGQLSSALGTTSAQDVSDMTDESTISATLATARNTLTTALMTSYLYKPLVGMSQSIAPNGLNTYYFYDALDRLEKVKDNNNQTVKSYKYNYAQ